MSISIADAVNKALEKLENKIAALETRVNNIENTRSVTTATPPTADGEGLPGFVVLDTKPETEYKNYVYIYPRD